MTSYQPQENPRRERSFPGTSTAQLGMYIFLGSLTVFFIAGLLGLVVTRLQSSAWRTDGMPPLPSGLLLSTAFLLVQAVFFRTAESALRGNRPREVERALGFSLGLGVLFLIVQALNWREMLGASVGVPVKSLYLFSFYLLTALHAAHVLGGVFALAFVFHRATTGTYSSSRSEGVRLVRQYWDFLLVVWLVLAAALYLCALG